jgi:hypothetical protein
VTLVLWCVAQVLWVSNNDFSGTLPPSWGSMPAMERLFVHQNVLQGEGCQHTLPGASGTCSQ